MNPLIPINAIQIRYVSPIFEPVYDDEDNQMGEDCVRDGTDVLDECIVAVSEDKLPRYYRLRYRDNAKDHKRRWEHWLEENLINGRVPYFIKVRKIGRRVLFEYDSTLIEKREKKLRAIQHKKEIQARKVARQVAASPVRSQVNESWDEWLAKLDADLTEQGLRVRTSEEIPSAFEEDDDEILIMEDEEWRLPDILVGETEQGEAVYEDRESGDLYEER
tara:strand:+ start:2448 stop:3104 length:657 start_codon:yes stop_codon:yes gene_type:complete